MLYKGRLLWEKHLDQRYKSVNPAYVSDQSFEIITEYYAESNRKLAQECNLPLEDFNYPI